MAVVARYSKARIDNKYVRQPWSFSRFSVTWRRRTRDIRFANRHRPFPIGGSLEPTRLYLYWFLEILGRKHIAIS